MLGNGSPGSSAKSSLGLLSETDVDSRRGVLMGAGKVIPSSAIPVGSSRFGAEFIFFESCTDWLGSLTGDPFKTEL